MQPTSYRLVTAASLCALLAISSPGCGPRDAATPTAADTPAAASLAANADTASTLRDSSDDDDEDGSLLAARARQGLAIAPVALNTKGLNPRQRTLVGLGSYLVNAAGDCTGCHTASPSKYLAGGVPFFLGGGHVVWTRNLTPDAATGLPLTLAQFKESLRTGRDFHANQSAMLVVMPWLYLRWESDRDLEAIYTYLRAIPPVTNAVPADAKDGLGLPAAIPFPGQYTDGAVVRALPADGASFSWRRGLAISPHAQPAHLEGDAARQYGVGSYLANATIACNECHTHPDRAGAPPRVNTAAWLTGGTVFLTPPPLQPVTGYVRATSANLEGATAGFLSEPGSTYARFQDVIHTGTLVDETPPRPLAFPMFIVAQSLRNLLDGDLRALYAYLDLSPRTTGPSDVARQPPARYCSAALTCDAGETCSSATNECVGGSCATDADCGTCQTCSTGKCQAPLPTSTCLLTAQ